MYRRSTRQRLALAALLAATATVVTLDFRENPGGPVRRVQNFAVSVVAPLQDGVARAFRPVGDFLSGLSQIGDLRSENARLQRELEQVKVEQRRFPELLRENKDLRELIKQKDWTQGPTVGARVIGVGPSNHEWTAFLDKGRSDGLREDMAVVSSEGLVGRLVLVGGSYSKVLLMIDPEHSVGARLTGSGETGVLSGRSEDNLLLEFIDTDVPVAVGETVVTSGYDRGIYPPGIPVGRIASVKASRDRLTKTATVKPFVDFTRLDNVLILLSSGPIESTGP